MAATDEQRQWVARVLGVPLLVLAPQEHATPLLPIWTGAKEEIDGQLNGMLAYLRASTNPLGPKIAELGVSGLLKGLGVALADGHLYDLTARFLTEYVQFPAGAHDDLLDAVSRFIDLEPVRPVVASQYDAELRVYWDR
jgi:hypothetical protein